MPRVAKPKQQTQVKGKRGKQEDADSQESYDDVKQRENRQDKGQKKTTKLVVEPKIRAARNQEKAAIEIEVFETKPSKKVKQSNAKKTQINSRYYPEIPHLSFPDNFQETLLKVIASLENKGNIGEILDNLKRFYIDEVNMRPFDTVLRHYEEEGIVYENNGVYGIHHAYVPLLPQLVIFQNEKLIEQEFHEEEHNIFKSEVQGSFVSISIAKDEDLLAGRDSAHKLFGDVHKLLLDDDDGDS